MALGLFLDPVTVRQEVVSGDAWQDRGEAAGLLPVEGPAGVLPRFFLLSQGSASPSDRTFHPSPHRIPDDDGDTVTLLTAFLSLFSLSPTGLVFSRPPSYAASQSAVAVAWWGLGPLLLFFWLQSSPPSLLSSVWMPGVFYLPGELGSGEERECVIGITVFPCGENRYEFKSGNVCKRLWGQSWSLQQFI